MGDPEPLLLIYNQKPQVLKLHILGKDPVGADDNIHPVSYTHLDVYKRQALSGGDGRHSQGQSETIRGGQEDVRSIEGTVCR